MSDHIIDPEPRAALPIVGRTARFPPLVVQFT